VSCYEPTAWYIFVFNIIRCVTSEMHNKRCVSEGKWRGKRQLQWFGFTQTSWKNFCKDWGDSIRILDLSEEQERYESKRQAKRCSCPSSWWHSRKLVKIPIPNHLYLTFDEVGKTFSDYKPGTNWCTNCKVEADKKFKEHGKYIPRKRKTCNKQKVEQFLTLSSVSSRCAS